MKKYDYDFGIDIDNVIMDYSAACRELLRSKFNIDIGLKELNENYSVSERILKQLRMSSVQEWNNEFNKVGTTSWYHNLKYFKNETYGVIKELAKSRKICFITSYKEAEEARRGFIELIFPGIELIFTEEKWKVDCKYYIDDYYVMLNSLLEHKEPWQVLAIAYDYNKNVKCKRFNTLQEAVESVTESELVNTQVRGMTPEEAFMTGYCLGVEYEKSGDKNTELIAERANQLKIKLAEVRR